MTEHAADPVLASTRFRISADDVTAAQRKHMRWLARRPRTWVYLVGFVLLCVASYAVTSPGWGPIPLAASAVGCLGFMVVWCLAVYAAMPFLGRRAMKTQPNLSHEWRVDLSEHGVRGVTPNQDSFVAWADYVAWGEDARVLLIYQSDRLFQFVPKRGLEPNFLEVVRRLAARLPRR